MKITTRAWLLAAGTVMTVTASLDAHGAQPVYYYPLYVHDPCGVVVAYRVVASPVVVVPAAITAVPAISPNLRRFAPQTPAPPSGEAPAAPHGLAPQVIESRTPTMEGPPPKFYDAYYVAGSTADPPKNTCSVAFWNLADRPLALHVAGRSHMIASRHQVTLDLPREFQWQINQRPPEPTQVAQEQSALEIVIRR